MSQTGMRKLLDCWSPPEWAGEPVGCIATTFTFDAALFEEECLARFLSLDTDPVESDSLFLIEREEKLASLTCAAVLVDSRRTRCHRSLRWDVLPVRLPREGSQHAKIALLVWERLIRAVVGSANLSEPGYLRNQEVFGVLDCPVNGTGPLDALGELTDFIEELVGLTQTSSGDLSAPASRCRTLLDDVHQRAGDVETARSRRASVRFVGLAPGRVSVVEELGKLWPGRQAPNRADVVSPFFDLGSSNRPALALWDLMKSRRRAKLGIHTSGEARPAEQGFVLHAPQALKTATTAPRKIQFQHVRETDLPAEQGPLFRPLHAKSIRLANDRWRTLLVGSSNFTSAGLGLGPTVNVEANLCYIADAHREPELAAALDSAWLEGDELNDDEITLWQPREDLDAEGDDATPPLPPGFEDAEFFVEHGDARLRLRFGAELPAGWWVRSEEATEILIDERAWQADARPSVLELPWQPSLPPAGLEVGWPEASVPAWWPVNVRDGLALPPVEELRSLSLEALIEILTSARPLLEVMRRRLRRQARRIAAGELPDLATDPHQRVDTSEFLLNRARRTSWAIAGLCEKLSQPVATERALEWRLHGPVGADALVKALIEEAVSADERAFVLGELALSLARIEPQAQSGSLPREDVRAIINMYVNELVERVKGELDSVTPSLATYVEHALGAARRSKAA